MIKILREAIAAQRKIEARDALNGTNQAPGQYEEFLFNTAADILAAQWTSVEEGLPEGDESVEWLISISNHGHSQRKYYYCTGNFLAKEIQRINKSEIFHVAHWQPITAPEKS